MHWYRRSLYAKIALIIVGTLLLSILTLIIMMRGVTHNLIENQLNVRGFEVGNYIAVLSTNDILQENHYAILERINKTKDKNKDVRYILIANYMGQVIADTFIDGLPEGLPATVAVENMETYIVNKFNSNEGVIYEIVVPIENGNVGFVRVGMSSGGMQQILNHTLTEFSLMAIILCTIAVILASWQMSVIIRPIQKLSQAAEEIKNSNYSVQTLCKSADEIGRLSQTFNEMAASLKQKEDENNELLKALQVKEYNRTILISKLFTAQEDERKRISRELHDGAGQSITSLLAYLKILSTEVKGDRQHSLINSARDVIVSVLGELRQMAVDLRPPALDDLGLVAAIEKYLHTLSVYHIKIVLNADEQQLKLPDSIVLALYRILQEAITNIIRHAGATEVEVSLVSESEYVKLIIADNGCGFSDKSLENARRQNRLGLYGIQERVEILNGNLAIQSTVGTGTKIMITIPTR
ncbi:HAMP domain-containing sensor histidine kinase [Sporomusa acidovorans]|uniref:histidine kinase n=1 Tax=Sporomusa acidovorans (strain ATCC 49682 / DSM 3132 / Mol) TaxID=1123286 RepID=A0ABZ3J2X3_SPOA4|nr:ATP-binding protein [Sporomusa acidovorans]OZC15763.1 signal transduction histidine-protein kinase/phosphatase DegS [Sporomusa acidovorans DSM 3132]SDF63017.1 Histidine kinase-, DNA gyrase B-, and HSP90-like ATPase [Sporomusa acidovorans]